MTLRTIAQQVLLSLGFTRKEYWSVLPFPSPGDLPDPRTESASPALVRGFFFFFLTNETLGKPIAWIVGHKV